MYLVDTDIAVHLRDGTPDVMRRAADRDERPVISLLTMVELEGGVASIPALSGKRRAALDILFADVAVLPFDRATVGAYRSILNTAGYSRRKVIDRLIAATAMVNDLPLVTMNADDFRDIPGLQLEIWPAPGVQ